MALFEQDTPLTLVEISDWACKSNLPTSIHNPIRTSYGDGVMDRARLAPFGVEYALADFLAALPTAEPVLERTFAFGIKGHVTYRKPSRRELQKVFNESLDALSDAVRGRPYVFALEDIHEDPHWTDAPGRGGYGVDYLAMLARAVFLLCPSGDSYVTGCATEALEMGAIPIMENPAAFKGCAHPAGYYEALGLNLTVKNWHELPELLAFHFDRDDYEDHVVELHDAVTDWWAAWKKDVADDIVAFRREVRANPPPENACARVALSDDEVAAQDAAFEAYYARDHWFDDYHDSPFDGGSWCSKYENGPRGWSRGAPCFDPACAPPSAAAFACGGAAAAADVGVEIPEATDVIRVFTTGFEGWAGITLEYFISEVLPDGVAFEFVGYDDLAILVEDAPFAPGDVVVYDPTQNIRTRDTPAGVEINPRCVYNWADSDPLLLAPAFMSLLEQRVPLTLVEGFEDWSCKSRPPASVHNYVRTSYSSNGVMDHATLLPFGPEYHPLDDFVAARNTSRRVLDRPLAFGLQNTLEYRKPSRAELDRLYGASRGALVDAVRGRPFVFELRNQYDNDDDGRDYGVDYLGMLARAVFLLCPSGDSYVTGCATQALEMGAIPIMENPVAFKGCEDPAGYYEALGLNVTVKNWHELPELLAFHFDRDDYEDHIVELHDAVMDWWAAWKKDVADDIVAFRREVRASPPPENACARVALSDDEVAAQDAAFEAYYARDHWFDDYRDSPFDGGSWCSKYENGPDGWTQAPCFDAACAPASASAFACGGEAVVAAIPAEAPATDVIRVYHALEYEAATTVLTFLGPLLPAGVAFEGVAYADLDALVASAVFEPGDVVIYSVMAEVATGDAPGGAVDLGCAYTFAGVDRLLLAPALMSLLEQPVPLTLVEATDWACKVRLPASVHHYARSSYGDNGAMDGATLLPFGIEYGPLADFLAALPTAKPVLERTFAFGIKGHVTYRKPSRRELQKVFNESLDALSDAVRGRPYVFALVDIHADNAWQNAFFANDASEEVDYLEMLADSVFALCPAGDTYVSGCVSEALEMGAIPIMENPVAFKGCEDPAGFYERLGLGLTVKNWHELPELLASHFDRDDYEDHVVELHGAVMDWYRGWKQGAADSIADFRREVRASPPPENACARVPPPAAAAAQDAAFAAYYAQDHWFDNYHDSVWDPGVWCSKFLKGPQTHVYIMGAGCFDSERPERRRRSRVERTT
ncbi:hypothetical protein JL721_6264 [Aureococcus anophagefferens]|nr:hypothetical protein JL721_6264 [Aureococcus anophagefferens]